jgi:hypothetical protein
VVFFRSSLVGNEFLIINSSKLIIKLYAGINPIPVLSLFCWPG